MIGSAIALGLAGGLGLAIVLSTVPAWQRNVSARVAPYVTDISAAAFQLSRQQHQADWVQSGLAWFLARIFDRFGPSTADMASLARRAGLSGGAAKVRMNALLFAIAGLTLGTFIALSSAGPLFVRLLLPVIGAVLGAVIALFTLRMRAQRRSARIAGELPTVLEFLMLCVSAGEALPDAIRRIAHGNGGELAVELSEVVRRTSLGIPLTKALSNLATELRIPAFDRLVSQLQSAIDRGSPLVEVLRAQAGDLRVSTRRELMEAAGRKEIWMMLPLVFFILPVTILFAVWPGIIALNTGL